MDISRKVGRPGISGRKHALKNGGPWLLVLPFDVPPKSTILIPRVRFFLPSGLLAFLIHNAPFLPSLVDKGRDTTADGICNLNHVGPFSILEL